MSGSKIHLILQNISIFSPFTDIIGQDIKDNIFRKKFAKHFHIFWKTPTLRATELKYKMGTEGTEIG